MTPCTLRTGSRSARLAPPILLLLALVTPSATAAQAEPSGVVRSACETEGEWRPAETPLSAYMDSALVVAALRSHWNPEWERVIATISTPPDSSDSSDRVWVGTRARNTEGLDRVGAWLLQVRNDTPVPERESIEVLIGDDGEFGLRGVRFTSCEPLLASRERVAQAMRDLGRAFAHDFAAREISVAEMVAWMYVDENGEVGDTQIDEPSLLPELDTEVMEAFRRYARFDPARHEGIPVGVWVAMPVTIHPGRDQSTEEKSDSSRS